ncbi:MAG: disulfide bond formation protein B [Acinetobacter sp.]|nr:disulfide bond formation protein B [Acinetobacter sp.]MBP6353085.1 disulfide bond formation protein B [Acinetobacter sp.]MBP7217729.1 disulfide bond formation protein B [Acinetobacter sp.]
MRWNYRLVSAVLVLCSIIGLTFALYLEHVQGLEPCPLCVFQRVGLIGMGLIALLAFIHNPISNAMKRGYALLAAVAIGWSVAVAARHVWLQHLPPDKVPSCGPGLNYLVDALPFNAVLKEVLSGSGECAVIDWTFLGQSLPFWSLIYFSLILLICLWQLFRSYKFTKK